MSIRNCTDSSSSSSDMRIIYIEKVQQPINLDEMVSVNSYSWKKAACFNNLVDSVDSVVNSHTIADIVAMVTNEIPIDSGASLQEAQSTSKFIVESVLHPTFLTQLHSLLHLGTKPNLATLRTSNIARPTLYTSIFVAPCTVPPLLIISFLFTVITAYLR